MSSLGRDPLFGRAVFLRRLLVLAVSRKSCLYAILFWRWNICLVVGFFERLALKAVAWNIAVNNHRRDNVKFCYNFQDRLWSSIHHGKLFRRQLLVFGTAKMCVYCAMSALRCLHLSVSCSNYCQSLTTMFLNSPIWKVLSGFSAWHISRSNRLSVVWDFKEFELCHTWLKYPLLVGLNWRPPDSRSQL